MSMELDTLHSGCLFLVQQRAAAVAASVCMVDIRQQQAGRHGKDMFTVKGDPFNDALLF